MIRVQTFPPQMVAALPAVVPESGLSWIPVGKNVPQIVLDFSPPNIETFRSRAGARVVLPLGRLVLPGKL